MLPYVAFGTAAAVAAAGCRWRQLTAVGCNRFSFWPPNNKRSSPVECEKGNRKPLAETLVEPIVLIKLNYGN